jgi:hypothetical protein
MKEEKKRETISSLAKAFSIRRFNIKYLIALTKKNKLQTFIFYVLL